MLTIRQEQILADIVKNHLQTTEPVGSKLLASKKRWRVSPATLRNEMAVLEKEGLVTHQHTSSGRLPTVHGYRYFRDHFLKPQQLSNAIKKQFRVLAHEYGDREASAKKIAQKLAECAEAAVIIAFNRDYLYYTGLSNLFSNPEFFHHDYLFHVARVLDKSEEEIVSILDEMDNDAKIFIGDEMQFLDFCSCIAASFTHNGERGMIGIIGPMRMDYNKNYALITFVKELIS